MVGQGANHIDGGDFEHDVHTALEVEAEVNLTGLALAVGVGEPNLLRGHGIKILSLAVNEERVGQALGVKFIAVCFGGNQLLS